jgi:hypothetical protein
VNDDFTTRRDRLVAEIARQRGELAQAYLHLEKPIHYAEYGMRGFGFIRKNPWIFAAAPALLSIAKIVFWGKKKKSSKLSPTRERAHAENKKPLQTWIRRGWQLYQLYRRARAFLP